MNFSDLPDDVIRISHPTVATGFLSWYLAHDCTCYRDPDKCIMLKEYKRYRLEVFGEQVQ